MKNSRLALFAASLHWADRKNTLPVLLGLAVFHQLERLAIIMRWQTPLSEGSSELSCTPLPKASKPAWNAQFTRLPCLLENAKLHIFRALRNWNLAMTNFTPYAMQVNWMLPLAALHVLFVGGIYFHVYTFHKKVVALNATLKIDYFAKMRLKCARTLTHFFTPRKKKSEGGWGARY